MSDLTLQLLAATQRELNNMQLRAEAAEKALAVEIEGRQAFYDMKAERDAALAKLAAAEKALAERTKASMHWELRFHQTLGERDDLRAELEKMKSDRDQFADEADDLRAKGAALVIENRKIGEHAMALEAKLAQCEKDWDEEVTDAEAKLARQHEGVKGWMRDYTDAVTEADELRAKLEEARAVVGRVATERDRACSRADELEDIIDTVRGESNELRDKLAAAEASSKWNLASFTAAMDQRDAVRAENSGLLGAYGELESKLAAAEAMTEAHQRTAMQAIDSRDAALARVRELEESLADHKKDLARCWPEWEKAHQANDDLVSRHLKQQARVAELEAKDCGCAFKSFNHKAHCLKQARVAALEEALRELLGCMLSDRRVGKSQGTHDVLKAAVAHARQVLEQP